MNGGIIGKANTSIKGVWTPGDVLNDTNNIAKKQVLVDPCNSTVGWWTADTTTSGYSMTLNTERFLTGNGALNLVKTTTSGNGYYYYRFAGLNLTGKDWLANVYIAPAKAAYIKRLSLMIWSWPLGSVTRNTSTLYHDMLSGFAEGWQVIGGPVSGFTVGLGTPDVSKARVLGFGYEVTANSVKLAAGDLVLDSLAYRRV